MTDRRWIGASTNEKEATEVRKILRSVISISNEYKISFRFNILDGPGFGRQVLVSMKVPFWRVSYRKVGVHSLEKWQNALYISAASFDVHLPLCHQAHKHTHTHLIATITVNYTRTIWSLFLCFCRIRFNWIWVVGIKQWVLLLRFLSVCFFYVSFGIMIIAIWYCFRAGRIYLFRERVR